MFIIFFSVSVHDLGSWHHFGVLLVAVYISAPGVDLRRKHWFGLTKHSLLSLIFTFVKIVILPVNTEVHEFFINLIYLMVC